MIKFFDLFAGIGGFRLGLERCGGFECVGASEIDIYPKSVYLKQFGDRKREGYREFEGTPSVAGDIRQLGIWSIPDFDVLCAGFPCQAFSVSGKELGFDDPRGNIFFEIARVALEKRPRILFLENVRGLLSHGKGHTFRRVIDTLYEVGYDVEWQVINGKYFLPQNRERVYIIGHLRDKPTPAIFPVGEGTKVNEGSRGEKQEDGQGLSGTHPHTRAIDSCYYKGWGGNRSVIKMVYMAHTKGNIKQRVQDRSVTWTLDTTDHYQGIIADAGIRRLTPLECERLQGFPDNWTDILSDTRRYKAIGNAVMPPVVEYLGKELKTILE